MPTTIRTFCVAVALALCAVSCNTPPPIVGPFHKIGNFFVQPLPERIRRVAMLPLTSSLQSTAHETGRDLLQPALFGELSKSRLFEVVAVPTHKVEEWTGKRAWTPEEKLPASFLGRIKEETACDAVLFTQLTSFRAYPPLALGWRLLMVDATNAQVLWAVDEVFDAGDPAVINSARRYAQDHSRTTPGLAREHYLLNSPREFAQFTANEVVRTITLK
jgi:hypothetical protein